MKERRLLCDRTWYKQIFKLKNLTAWGGAAAAPYHDTGSDAAEDDEEDADILERVNRVRSLIKIQNSIKNTQ